jgi:hypothetical protein
MLLALLAGWKLLAAVCMLRPLQQLLSTSCSCRPPADSWLDGLRSCSPA